MVCVLVFFISLVFLIYFDGMFHSNFTVSKGAIFPLLVTSSRVTMLMLESVLHLLALVIFWFMYIGLISLIRLTVLEIKVIRKRFFRE